MTTEHDRSLTSSGALETIAGEIGAGVVGALTEQATKKVASALQRRKDKHRPSRTVSPPPKARRAR